MTKKTAAKNPARRPSIAAAKPAAKKATKPAAPLLGEHPVPAAKMESPKPRRAGREAGAAHARRPRLPAHPGGEVERRGLGGAQGRVPDAGPSHSYYPEWYRAHLVMEGTITKAFAREHRGEPVRRAAPAAAPLSASAPAPQAEPKKLAAKKAAK
jgi:hypothetical protein